jgi:hypothetical protein
MAKRSRKRQTRETKQDGAEKSMKRKIRLIAIAAALSTGGTLLALLPPANAETPPSPGQADAADCQEHKIEVKPDPGSNDKWSVYGDLYAGNGDKVYHWEEVKKPAGRDYVEWKFDYCGDNGWADVVIKPSGRKTFYQRKLALDRDHCWRMETPEVGRHGPVLSHC